MSGAALKLAVYFGDRDFAGRRLLADAVLDVFERHAVAAGVLLRGIEGFGIEHRMHTERLLTLSEDLPVVAIALDAQPRIEAVLAEVRDVSRHGLLTLERARLLAGPPGPAGDAAALGATAKLTLFTGRGERVDGAAAHVAAVACLHRHGMLGAGALLGLDGTLGGRRRRARFLSRNRLVPMMVSAVGEADRADAALAELRELLPAAPAALERVQVCKRDGRLLAAPQPPPGPVEDGLARWQKLTVHTGGEARHAEEPLHGALLRRLRGAGAAGATTLRALWGFHGAHAPHGERPWSLTRHSPLQTVVIDTPANVARWFEVVDELTGATGLVTLETVPALRAAGPSVEHGGLRLAPLDGG